MSTHIGLGSPRRAAQLQSPTGDAASPARVSGPEQWGAGRPHPGRYRVAVPLRLGVCLLPDLSWPEARAQWRDVEAAGIVTGWVYDHLSWRTLRDGPWLGAVPLLSALAAVTDTIRLGFLVASPNFRHPVPFAKELMTLDVISGGRVDLGLGAGGTGADATVLGGPGWSGAERATRFAETATLLDLLLRQPATSWRGVHYAADDARQIPGCVQHPRIPFTIAATGPRGLAMTAALGQGWVTYGPVTGTPGPSEWLAAVLGQSAALDRACGEGGGYPSSVARRVLLGLELDWARRDAGAVREVAQALEAAGFTELIVHAPRPHDRELPGPSPGVFESLLARG